MPLDVPDDIRTMYPGQLVATSTKTEVTLYLREEDFGMKKYPRRCPVELRLSTWEIDHVVAVVILVRLARTDLTTFECWVNAGEPNGVRAMQCLASQPQIDVHVVADREVRSLRRPNPLRLEAMRVVKLVRHREAWPQDGFQRACARITQLYPTAHALWWARETARTE